MSWNFHQASILSRQANKSDVKNRSRGGSRAAATSKVERFVIIVNGWKPVTIITKRSILDVAAILDPPLRSGHSITHEAVSF